MANSIYLIDSENVGSDWTTMLPKLDETDQVIVFYTNRSPHVGYEGIILVAQSGVSVEYIKCHEGNNALDFQLVSELGFRLHDNEDKNFIILTKDTGFDSVVKYWSEKNYHVTRIGKSSDVESDGSKRTVPVATAASTVQPKKEIGTPKRAATNRITSAAEYSSRPTYSSRSTTAGYQGRQTGGYQGRQAISSQGRTMGGYQGRTTEGYQGRTAYTPSNDSTRPIKKYVPAPEKVMKPKVIHTPIAAPVVEGTNEKPEGVLGYIVYWLDEMKCPDSIAKAMIVREIFMCIKSDNLMKLHSALSLFAGPEYGGPLFNKVRDCLELHEEMDKVYIEDKQKRWNQYVGMVIRESGLKGVSTESAVEYIQSAPIDNKFLFRAGFHEVFGKELGEAAYKAFRSHTKILAVI